MSSTDTGGWVVFYNKDLFDQRGVPYPTDDWTWEDFQIAVEKLSFEEGGTKYYGYSRNNHYWFMWLLPMRKDGLLEWDRIVEPQKALWNQPGIVEAMQWFSVDMLKNGWEPPPSVLAGGGVSVWSGRVALCFDGPWRLPRLWGASAEKQGGINYDVAMLPKGNSGKSETMPFVHGHVIAKPSQNPDAAWELIKFILSDVGQETIAQGGRQCGRRDTMEKFWAPIATQNYNFSNSDAFVGSLEEGRQALINGVGGDWGALTAAGAPMPNAHDRFTLGHPAQEVLDELNKSAQEVLDNYWKERS